MVFYCIIVVVHFLLQTIIIVKTMKLKLYRYIISKRFSSIVSSLIINFYYQCLVVYVFQQLILIVLKVKTSREQTNSF
jgi:hypothetical protein